MLAWNVTRAQHQTYFEVDSWEKVNWGIDINIYNKSKYELVPQDYLWMVTFDDGTKRLYKSSGGWCQPYSDCGWGIVLRKKGVVSLSYAHE